MTYCVAMSVDSGMVFLADSRTNAGVDQVGTFRKMSVFENPGERMMVLMTSGNLSISQAVRQIVASHVEADGTTIWNAPDMYAAARIVGAAVRTVHREEAAQLAEHGVDFNIGIVFGGQIRGERCRLFYVYSAGNFIESHDENPYFQIGEAKYGKPIIDRVVTPRTSLDDAAKCALISMDSTLRSNISRPAARPARVRGRQPGRHPLRHHRRTQRLLQDAAHDVGPATEARLRGDRGALVGRGVGHDGGTAGQPAQPSRAHGAAP